MCRAGKITKQRKKETKHTINDNTHGDQYTVSYMSTINMFYCNSYIPIAASRYSTSNTLLLLVVTEWEKLPHAHMKSLRIMHAHPY